MFLLRGGLLSWVVWWFLENDSLTWYLLRSSASWYSGALDSNDFASEDKDDRRLLIDAGSCLITLGGWVERESIYNGLLFGLRYGR